MFNLLEFLFKFRSLFVRVCVKKLFRYVLYYIKYGGVIFLYIFL